MPSQSHPALARQTLVWEGAPIRPDDASRASWARDKFFVIRGMVPKAPLEALAQEVLEAHREAFAHGARLGGALSGHLNFSTGKKARAVADTMRERGLLDLLGDVYGAKLAWSSSGGNLNLPGSHAQHYHMDSNYSDEFVPVMVAMTPTTEENGAIELIAESAQKPLRYADFLLNGMSRRRFRVPMDVGDVLVRSSCVWHRGMPNLTSRPRPILTLALHRAEQVAPDFDPFTGSEVRLSSNFYSQGASGKLKEALVVRAPWLFAGMRAAKSLFAPADAST